MDSAQTRFENDRIRNQQSQLVLPAAQQALHTVHKPIKPTMPPVGQPPSNPTHPVVPGFTPVYQAPQAPAQPVQNSNPLLDTLTRSVHLDKLINSKEMADANTLVRLRHHLQGRKPTEQKTAAEVLGVLSSYLPSGGR